MLQRPAQWAEDEKGNCKKGSKKHDGVPSFIVTPSVLKKEYATKKQYVCLDIEKKLCQMDKELCFFVLKNSL